MWIPPHPVLICLISDGCRVFYSKGVIHLGPEWFICKFFFNSPNNSAIISFLTNAIVGQRSGVAGFKGVPLPVGYSLVYAPGRGSEVWLPTSLSTLCLRFLSVWWENSISSLSQFEFSWMPRRSRTFSHVSQPFWWIACSCFPMNIVLLSGDFC